MPEGHCEGALTTNAIYPDTLVCSFETNSCDGTPLPVLRTLAHEFAHALNYEIEILKSGFTDKLRKAYNTAYAHGTWDGAYANTDYREYWAEGVAMWFYEIGSGRGFETYEAFFERDPLLAELLDEWFPRVSFSEDY